jgi:hypothetical protein
VVAGVGAREAGVGGGAGLEEASPVAEAGDGGREEEGGRECGCERWRRSRVAAAAGGGEGGEAVAPA